MLQVMAKSLEQARF